MPDTGWRAPTVVSGPAWNNPDSIKISDGSAAWQNIGANTTTAAIVCKGFGLSIPAGNTPVGVEVRIRSQSNVAATHNTTIVSEGVAVGVTRTVSVASGDRQTTTGGVDDLFGWVNATKSLIESAEFAISVTATTGAAGGFIFLDFLEARVTYSPSGQTPVLAQRRFGRMWTGNRFF